MKIRNHCRLPLLLTVALGSAFALSAKSQESIETRPRPLTLSVAVQNALINNPEIRVLQADVASARGELTIAKTWDNPDLTVSPGFKQFRDLSDTQFHGDFGLEQPFEWPGKRALRRAIAEKDVELRGLALDGFRSQLAIQVRHAYLALQTAQQVAALREQQLAVAKAFADAARKKVEAGFAPDFEATKAEVEIVAAQKSLREAKAQGDVAVVRLNTLMGAKPDQKLDIAEVAPESADFPSRTKLLAVALAENPALKLKFTEAARAGLELRSTRKSRLPDFRAEPNVEYTRDEQIYGFGVTLPLPLWNRKQGEITRANAELEKVRAGVDQLQREIAGDVTAASQDLAAANDSLAYYTTDLRRKLKTALDTAEQSYAEGRTSLLLYLEAQRTYFDTQADYFSTLQKLHDAESALASAVGLPLGQIHQTLNQNH
jgi:cobalt-zinc-cadmium efflux system outer membrane protein